MAKDAIVVMGIVLFFTLLIIVVVLWCDLRLQQIQQHPHPTLQTEFRMNQ